MDAIIIEGLKVDTVIGCFNWERQIIQPLMLDLTIHNDLSRAAASDKLEIHSTMPRFVSYRSNHSESQA
jgi:dihydroneopterin aldolase